MTPSLSILRSYLCVAPSYTARLFLIPDFWTLRFIRRIGCEDVSHACGLATSPEDDGLRYDAVILLCVEARGKFDVTGFSDFY